MKHCLFLLLFASTLRAEDAIDRLAKDALKAWQVPGVAIAIVQGDRTTFSVSGLREHGQPQPLTVDDVFPLASCTKAFTTTLLAQLADEGKLTWDDPVRRHVPNFHLSDPNADAMVNLRDLLAHRTGLPRHDYLWYRSTLTTAEIVERIGKLPLTDPFRASFQYSTLMYMVAGQAAANAAGKPWHVAVEEKLFVPLGMTSATCTTNEPRFVKAPKAAGHQRTAVGRIERMPRYEHTVPNPAGSINLSIRDMEPWLRLHLSGGLHRGQRLVSAANLAVTHTPQMVIPLDDVARRMQPECVQLSYGMGWLISDYRGLKIVSHGGLVDGFRLHVILVPDRQLGIAIFSNLHQCPMNFALANTLVDHCLGLPTKDWNAFFLAAAEADRTRDAAAWAALVAARKKLLPKTHPDHRYAGEYVHPAYGTMQIAWKDNRLEMNWSTFTAALEHWGNEDFLIREGHLEKTFVEFKVNVVGPEALRFQGEVFLRK